MSSFPLRLPDDLKERAAAQAEAAGVSLNQYIATVLASRVGLRHAAHRDPEFLYRNSYKSHYRQMVPQILRCLEFRSNPTFEPFRVQ
jgi:hypothetical protein